jgi:uncharacterized membrane protein
MDKTYIRIAGQSLERLAAHNECVFAIAMTLIVLEIRIAARAQAHSEHDLWRALLALGPRLPMYLVTFMTMGIFWVGQQTQLNLFIHAERNLAWIHIGFLAAVSITSFSTMLMGQFITYRVALAVNWLNILLLGGTLLWNGLHACAARLAKPEVTETVDRAIVRRIVITQASTRRGRRSA